MKRLAILVLIVGCKVFDPATEAEKKLGDGAACSDPSGGYIRCVRGGQPFTCIKSDNMDRKRRIECFAGSPPMAESK